MQYRKFMVVDSEENPIFNFICVLWPLQSTIQVPLPHFTYTKQRDRQQLLGCSQLSSPGSIPRHITIRWSGPGAAHEMHFLPGHRLHLCDYDLAVTYVSPPGEQLGLNDLITQSPPPLHLHCFLKFFSKLPAHIWCQQGPDSAPMKPESKHTICQPTQVTDNPLDFICFVFGD